jgi:hypothetical protein
MITIVTDMPKVSVVLVSGVPPTEPLGAPGTEGS